MRRLGKIEFPTKMESKDNSNWCGEVAMTS